MGIAQKTVLLVEDNEDNRMIYATALRYAGYEVLEATTGVEGVYEARTHRPDLVLMDISLPERGCRVRWLSREADSPGDVSWRGRPAFRSVGAVVHTRPTARYTPPFVLKRVGLLVHALSLPHANRSIQRTP
jgi:hypothetical protein